MEIFLLQDSKDIAYFESIKNNKNIFILPLSLSGLVKCEIKNYRYLNPQNFYSGKFHKKNLLMSEKFEKNIVFSSKIKKYTKEEILVYLKFRFNSIIFLKDLLSSINKKKKIKKIFLPNKNYEEHQIDTFFLNEIFDFYLKNYKIEKVSIFKSNKIEKINCNGNYGYSIKNKIDKNKKNILLNDLGYNLKRILYLKKFKNINLYFFNEGKSGKLKWFLMKILKIYPINLTKVYLKNKNINYFANVKKDFLGRDFHRLFFILLKKFNLYFNDYERRGRAVKNFFYKNKFDLIIINSVRGISRLIDENRGTKQKLLNIPHGTVSENYNKYDKIYKNNIAKSVVSQKADYVMAQSQISKKFFLSQNYKKKQILLGNLIFSEAKQTDKDFILYAVTTKQFFNMHFLGVDMFYEFYENLKFLNKISKLYNLKVVVKLHPSESYNLPDLSKIFKNINFSNLSLDKLLKKSSVTLSFSSTVIEDSLNSRVPVILFDRWNRYKHFEVSKYRGKKFPIFYINNKNKLLNCINQIMKTSKFEFEDIIFLKNFKKNIKQNISNLI
jgi:hypothetical protein